MPLQLAVERATQEKDRFEEQCKWLQATVDEKVCEREGWGSEDGGRGTGGWAVDMSL